MLAPPLDTHKTIKFKEDEVKEQATLGGTIFGYNLTRAKYGYGIGEVVVMAR